MDSIKHAHKNLYEQSDFLVCEGTGHTGVGSICELNNAQVAVGHESGDAQAEQRPATGGDPQQGQPGEDGHDQSAYRIAERAAIVVTIDAYIVFAVRAAGLLFASTEALGCSARRLHPRSEGSVLPHHGRLLETAQVGARLRVVVEEVDVERRLYHAGDEHEPNEVVGRLGGCAVDPIEHVAAAVGSEQHDVVAGEVLHLSVALQQDELRDDGDGLEVDGEGPEDLHDLELLVEDERQQRAGQHGELEVQEGVVRLVVRAAEGLLEADDVHDGAREEQEQQLHDGVVHAHEVEEQVHVAGHEHEEEKLLRLERDAVRGAGRQQLEQQHQEAGQVRHVAHQAEQIHRLGLGVELRFGSIGLIVRNCAEWAPPLPRASDSGVTYDVSSFNSGDERDGYTALKLSRWMRHIGDPCPVVALELQFYEALAPQFPQLRPFVPEFLGKVKVELTTSTPNDSPTSPSSSQSSSTPPLTPTEPMTTPKKMRRGSFGKKRRLGKYGAPNPMAPPTSEGGYSAKLWKRERAKKNKKSAKGDSVVALTRADSGNTKDYLVLGDLTRNFRRPCVLDIKMGTRQHGEDASPAKVISHTAKCAATTSLALGLRLCGMQIYDECDSTYTIWDKTWGRQLKPEDIEPALETYLTSGSTLRWNALEELLTKIRELKSVMARTTGLRCWGSSLLLTYEGDQSYGPPSADVRLIDFAHCQMSSVLDTPDDGMLLGLSNIDRYLSNIAARKPTLEETDTAPASSLLATELQLAV
ncbi:unnamed protein product [Phytophthora fragariaefolia]|uniref:Kinase n=1 Tax=Phytophthora fragariaefolia TaxID=1490495 RepID=A0A9W6WT50_9STRA|nr:unnamed protein product [Phytophthora fragariaefolia]